MNPESSRKIHFAIDGTTKSIALVGQGISYSLSPCIHNLAIERLGRNLVYLPFDIHERSLNSFLEFYWDAGGLGFNVTTPHKGAVARLIPGHGLSSVNTIYRGDSGWEATSTDAEGFASGLERLGKSINSFSKIVVIGAGGAAVALIDYFARRAINAREIIVLARRPERFTSTTSDRSRSNVPYPQVQLKTLSAIELENSLRGGDESTLLIQATNAPQKGDPLASLVPAIKDFRGTMVDLVYGQPSALYFEALNKGLPTQDGEPMLIEQARASQRLWFGQAIAYEEIAEALIALRRSSS